MRKLCTVLMALVLVVLCVILMPTETQAGNEDVSPYLYFTRSPYLDGYIVSAQVTNVHGAPSGHLTIPATYKGEPVITIGNFRYNGITSITIPDTVNSISTQAFAGCQGLTSITIPDSVTSIGSSAFEGCTNLTNVKIGNGLTGIDLSVFEGCTSLTNITIGKNVRSILNSAFKNCTALRNVTLPDSVTIIGERAFEGCSSLTNITIPNGVLGLSEWAFYGCTNLTSLTIPDSVTSISRCAFLGCADLTSVIYCGTAEQWNAISIGGNNTNLTNATRNYHKWTTTATKEPTYTAIGEQITACTYCGAIKETINTPAKFYGTSINLGNTLDMYFGFYTGLVDEGGKVVFVREFADGTTETTEAPITSFKKNNSVYDITYTGLAAKEMCDTIHVYVYNSEGVLVGQHSDSIRSYVLRQLREKDYGAEFRTLCVDLLNYGAAAQVEFGYNADDLANKDLTDEELAEGTQTVGAYTDKQTIIGQATSYYGTAYILETQISMAMAVRADRIGADCYALVSYTDHTGTEKKDIRVEGQLNYSVYEFFLNEIVVADGRCLLTIDFYKADGTKVLTVQDSMESYTARNADVYPLAEKMLAFSDSAYNYLHRNDK